MPLIKQECSIPKCDFCSETLTNGDGFSLHFSSVGETLKEMGYYDWVLFTSKGVAYYYCGLCTMPLCKCGDSFFAHDQGDAECEEEPCGCSEYVMEEKETTC